jgi:DNA end-binding protein Ku
MSVAFPMTPWLTPRWMKRLAAGYRVVVPRPVWSGNVSFGLVSVAVKAFSAVHDHSVHFNQLQKRTGARIKYEKVSAKSGKPVPKEDIERGFELAKGKYVVVDLDELEALRPRSTKSVDITDFVALDAVDPIYYEHTYWLAPEGEAATRAYRLLQAAMEKAGRVAIGTVVMRNKQYLAAIRPLDGALAMSTMRFADEIVAQKKIDGIPSSRSKPVAKELALASQIIESLASDWDPARYHDTYTEELKDLIPRKAKGEKLTVEDDDEEPSGKVVDLMAALQASLESGRARTAKPARGAKTGAKKAAASKGDASGKHATKKKAQPRRRSA